MSEHSLPYDQATPGDLALIDQNLAAANVYLDWLIAEYREHRRDCPYSPIVCPGGRFVDIMLGLSHENWATLVGVAVDRLAEATDG